MQILPINNTSNNQTFTGKLNRGSYKVFQEAYEAGAKELGREFDKSEMNGQWMKLKKFVYKNLHEDSVVTLSKIPNKQTGLDEVSATITNPTFANNSGYIAHHTTLNANKSCEDNLLKLSASDEEWFGKFIKGTMNKFTARLKPVEEFKNTITGAAKNLSGLKNPMNGKPYIEDSVANYTKALEKAQNNSFKF